MANSITNRAQCSLLIKHSTWNLNQVKGDQAFTSIKAQVHIPYFPSFHIVTPLNTFSTCYFSPFHFFFFSKSSFSPVTKGSEKSPRKIRGINLIPLISSTIVLNTNTCTWIVLFIWHCNCHPLISKEYSILCFFSFSFFFLDSH